MKTLVRNDALVEDLFLAGERVPAGTYREVDSGRDICLEGEDYLPASLDGRVACYVCLHVDFDGTVSILQEQDEVYPIPAEKRLSSARISRGTS